MRGEAEALFWVGCFHQVVRGDEDAALPSLERSYRLAVETHDRLTQSYAVRHLAFADLAAGRHESALERFEESVSIRRELEFWPGVAAGLVALAYAAAECGREGEIGPSLDEASMLAERSGAAAVARWVEEARASLLGA